MADQDRAATKDMDQLLTSYEKGTLTRRELLSALALVGTSMSASAQPTVSPLQGRASMFHHVNIFVSTLRPIYPAPGGAAYGLDFNNGSFLSLIQTADPERVGTIDHFSIGIDNFDYERDTAAIKAAGITPAEVDRIELLHMTDPDGIAVQMTDTTNTIDCPRGIGMPPCEPVPGQAPR